MRAALADPRALRYQPLPQGLEWAREAVAAYYGGRVSPERILLTSSTSEAYGYLFKLLTDPGDEVLVPRPSYPLFEFLAGMELVHVVQYPLGRFDEIARYASSRSRAVVVVNPNNPTGSFLKREDAALLIEFCRDRGLAIISDEVFSDYGFGHDAARVTSLAGVEDVLTFSLSGLSKVAGMPQMKLGWIVVSGPAELRHAAMERLELIADTYLSVSTPVQWAAPKLLELGRSVQQAIRERTAENLRLLGQSCFLGRFEPEGGWYAVMEVPRTRSEEEWVLELLEYDDVLVQPGFFYDFDDEAYMVLSLLTPTDVFVEGLTRIVRKKG